MITFVSSKKPKGNDDAEAEKRKSRQKIIKKCKMTTGKIIEIVEKNTFNGVQRGMKLSNGETYFPFFKNLACEENIGKTLKVENFAGNKTEKVI